MRNKILMTLALLITAVGGAWAQDAYEEITTATKGTNTYTGDHFKITASQGCDKDGIKFWDMQNHGTATIEALNGEYITKIEMHMTYGGGFATSITTTAGTLVATNLAGNSNDISVIDINATSVEIGTNHSGASYIQISKFVIYYTTEPAGPTVTVNEAKTEAWFNMPAFDATAEYELVRDMSIQMTAQVGDGTQEQPRYRVKKDGNNKFIPADMEMAAVPALFTVNDAIEQKALTQIQDYIVQIYAIDAEGQPTGDPMTFATFTFEPGIYAVKAVAADGSDYDGETALSNTFKLFQGYEVTVPAGEFITYYKDEALKLEDADKQSIELYTVSSISNDKAVLSQACDAMPKNTPMLVYNKGSEDKTFLLIPCNDPDLALTVAPEFKGTLTATTIAASTANQTNYAFNGKQFVWVKDAINIGANKAWLSIENANARAINIVFDETTGLSEELRVKSEEFAPAQWYTVDGRKLQGKPTKKGMYILNGKKVVVK